MYESVVTRDDAKGDMRALAVGYGQLGTVRLMQRRFAEAVNAHVEARNKFEGLGEPASVAIAWHQMAMGLEQLRQFADAEHAYREALKIKVSFNDRAGEASTLGQLGRLYAAQERFEDAIAFYRQASRLYQECGDIAGVSRQEGNIGIALHKLGRLDEARRALHIALSLINKIGLAGQPWNAWQPLYFVERDAGCPDAAAEARGQAMETYRVYRLSGGKALDGQPLLVGLVGNFLQQRRPHVAETLLMEIRKKEADQMTADARALLAALDAIIAGNRDPALSEGLALEPVSAAELQLLLEQLARTD